MGYFGKSSVSIIYLPKKFPKYFTNIFQKLQCQIQNYFFGNETLNFNYGHRVCKKG
jgi:hypothetical protein